MENVEAVRRAKEEDERAAAAWVTSLRERFEEKKRPLMAKYFGNPPLVPVTEPQEAAVMRSHADIVLLLQEANARLEVENVHARMMLSASQVRARDFRVFFCGGDVMTSSFFVFTKYI